MSQNTVVLLFSLLRSAICGEGLDEKSKEAFSSDVVHELYLLSKKHDISHLIEYALNKNRIANGEQEFGHEAIKAAYRYEQLNYEYIGLCEILERAQIAFIPLKGSVIRKYYPEPWMRTSCDIDILVRENEAENIASYLVDNHGYLRETKTSHDISLFSPNNKHIELHYDLVELGWANASFKVLRAAWETSLVHEDKMYWREMPDEMFYFYHIAHMAKHFEQGGCGIRPFIDLWILDNIPEAEVDKRDELLRQGDLLKFAEAARLLSRVWLGGAEHTEITKQMESYVLSGGVYGTNENRIAIQQQKKGGRLKYALSKIFIPYDTIKFHYPILQKHRWLTPIMEVRRWFKLVFCGHAKRSMQELKHNGSISAIEAENIQMFLKNVGL